MLTMGLDIGSTACKCVILRDGRIIEARAVVKLGTGTKGPRMVFDEALCKAGAQRSEISRIMVTGYGRFTFDDADCQKSEITCHASGIHFLQPEVRTIIDIGGQDIKAIRINESGTVEDFVMNDKCAAGTGRFLDVMARVLDLSVEELGPLSEQSIEPVSISNVCTIFAESEVISKMSSNVRLPDLVAGIHASVAKRAAAVAFRGSVVPQVAMSGGVALNQGVVKALSKELHFPVMVHPYCQFAGAIGAAVLSYNDLCANQTAV